MSIQITSIPFEELISTKYSTCHYFASWSHTRQGLFQIALYFRSKYSNKRFKIMLLNQVSPQGPTQNQFSPEPSAGFEQNKAIIWLIIMCITPCTYKQTVSRRTNYNLFNKYNWLLNTTSHFL